MHTTFFSALAAAAFFSSALVSASPAANNDIAAPAPARALHQTRRDDIVRRQIIRAVRKQLGRRALPSVGPGPITCGGTGIFFLQLTDLGGSGASNNNNYVYTEYDGDIGQMRATSNMGSASIYTLDANCGLMQLSNGYSAINDPTINPSFIAFRSPEYVADLPNSEDPSGLDTCQVQDGVLACYRPDGPAESQFCDNFYVYLFNPAKESGRDACPTVNLKVIPV